MASIAIFEVDQTGDVGGPGVSRFATLGTGSSGPLTPTELNTVAAALLAMYTTIKPHLQSTITYSVNSICKIIDEASGGITSQQSIGTVGVTAGGAIGIYAAGTGARIYWHTNTVKGRRLIRGATYICPLDSGSYTNAGVISGSVSTLITGACNTYLNTLNTASITPVIYCRPHPKGATNGTHGSVTAVQVGSKVASLRSRRS